jgi:hypothetical protein
MRDGTERKQHAAGGQGFDLGLEEGPAGVGLCRRRLVRGRQALHRIRDSRGLQLQAIVRCQRMRTAGKAHCVQGPVKQDAREIAGERPTAGIGAMQSRREADNQQCRPGRSEGRHGSIVVVGKLLPQRVPVARQTGAQAAVRGWPETAAQAFGAPPLPANQSAISMACS